MASQAFGSREQGSCLMDAPAVVPLVWNINNWASLQKKKKKPTKKEVFIIFIKRCIFWALGLDSGIFQELLHNLENQKDFFTFF